MTAHRDIDTAERLRFFADRMEAEGHLNAARHMRNGAEEIEHLRERVDSRSRLAAPIQRTSSRTSPFEP